MNTSTPHNRDELPEAIEAYFLPPDIHEENRAGWAGFAPTMVVAALAAVGHAVITYLLFWQGLHPLLWFVGHMLIALACGLFARGLAATGMDARFALLLTIASTAIGVFGSFGTLLAMLLSLIYGRIATPFIDWFMSIFPRQPVSVPEQIYDDIVLGRDENALSYHVIPFMDVIAVGSESQKRQALSRMTSQFHPSFAPAFHTALIDESNTIRVQAATAIAKVEDAFVDRLMKIIAIEHALPDDMVVKLALADHYDNYAFTGILDPERERNNRKKAHGKYLEYLAHRPADIGARIKVGRLLLRNDDAASAADWFERSINEGHSNDSLRLWYLEALYRSGRFSALRQQARALAPRVSALRMERPDLEESILLWATAA